MWPSEGLAPSVHPSIRPTTLGYDARRSVSGPGPAPLLVRARRFAGWAPARVFSAHRPYPISLELNKVGCGWPLSPLLLPAGDI